MRFAPDIPSLPFTVALLASALNVSASDSLSASRFVRLESGDGLPIDASRLSPKGAADSGSLAWIDREGTLPAARGDQLGDVVAGGGSTSLVRPAPVRAQLAVPRDDDDARRKDREPGVEGDADPDGKQVPQRARVELDAGDAPVGVPIEDIRGREVVLQAPGVEDPDLGKEGVERGDVVPLRQEKDVARRVGEALLRDPQEPGVEADEEVDAGERRTEKAAASRGHPDDSLPDPQGEDLVRALHAPSTTRVAPGRTVLSSPRWCRYQFTPAHLSFRRAIPGLRARSARTSSVENRGRSSYSSS